MTSDKIISVDPAKATLGSLHPEVTARYLRNHLVESHHVNSSQKFVRFASGQTLRKSASIKMCLVRLMAGVMIMMTALLYESTAFDIPHAMLVASSATIALGFMTIPTAIMLTVFSLFGIITGMANQAFPMQSMMLMGLSIVLALFGPGRLSADFMIYKHIRRGIMNKRKRMRNNPITYKAFSNMQNLR